MNGWDTDSMGGVVMWCTILGGVMLLLLLAFAA